jgi:CBS domain-containing protein
MARFVREIMNRELFAVAPGARADQTLRRLVELHVGAAPVVDETGRPIGVVSVVDVVGEAERPASACMTAPAVVVHEEAPIEAAGRLLAETGHRHMTVVDHRGRAVGYVSSVDVLRGLFGLLAPHPAGFSHYDRETGAIWTDDAMLDEASADRAPDGPGLLVLLHGGPRMSETVVWAESVRNVRERLRDLVRSPQTHSPQLAFWIERGQLRFRASALPDEAHRSRLAAKLLDRVRQRLARLSNEPHEPRGR